MGPAALTFLAVLATLWIAWRDRRAARREAAQRWELEQLTRLAVLTAHGGVSVGAPPELQAQERERGAERLVLRWVLGGPLRFPLGLRADAVEVDDLPTLRRLRDDPTADDWVRTRAEVHLLACEAANAYRGVRPT